MQIFKLNTGENAIVVERMKNKKVIIKFENDYTPKEFRKEVRLDALKNGSVKNPYFPSVYGIGCLGNKKRKENVAAYLLWANILNRCYFKPKQAYKDCYVCKEWLCFETFEKWFCKNYIDGYHLDKDILIKGNKEYSPTTCCFVPVEINSLFTKTDSKRGKFKIGVSLLENKYYKVGFSKYGKIEYFGIYDNENTAFEVYKKEKEKYIKEIACNYFKLSKITRQVYNALMTYEVDSTD